MYIKVIVSRKTIQTTYQLFFSCMERYLQTNTTKRRRIKSIRHDFLLRISLCYSELNQQVQINNLDPCKGHNAVQ